MKTCLLLLTLLIGSLLPCSAAYDVFIRFNGGQIKGDSLNQFYPGSDGWSQLFDFSFGIENNITIGSVGGGGGAGRATFKELQIATQTDSLSAHMFVNCATGKAYDKVEIVAVRPAGGSGPAGKSLPRIFTLDLRLVFVQDVGLSGSDGDDVVGEAVILKYGAQEITFYKQDPKSGAEIFAGKATWSQVKNNASLEV